MERYRTEGGLELFNDRECAELLLEMARWRGNREQMADILIAEFGSFRNVLEARKEQLAHIRELGVRMAETITLITAMMRFWERLMMQDRDKIGCAYEAELYCKSLLMGLRNEQFYVICLNSQCKILGRRKVSEGTITEVNCYPRIVVESALNYNAHSVLLCHNHPGGSKTPSAQDISSTLLIQKLLAGVQITVLDHIIVCGNECYSMIRNGDIKYATT